MGLFDKGLRLLVAALIVVLFYLDIISGTLGIILLIAAGIFVITSLFSSCPLYTPFGISTCKTKKKEE